MTTDANGVPANGVPFASRAMASVHEFSSSPPPHQVSASNWRPRYPRTEPRTNGGHNQLRRYSHQVSNSTEAERMFRIQYLEEIDVENEAGHFTESYDSRNQQMMENSIQTRVTLLKIQELLEKYRRIQARTMAAKAISNKLEKESVEMWKIAATVATAAAIAAPVGFVLGKLF